MKLFGSFYQCFSSIFLYTFNLQHFSEAECLPAHFYSHAYPEAAFVNNLVICRKYFNDIQSLRNDELHQVQNGETQITKITSVEQLHQLLTKTFELNVEFAISEFLFSKFVTKNNG